jgi:hypothetical protein
MIPLPVARIQAIKIRIIMKRILEKAMKKVLMKR